MNIYLFIIVLAAVVLLVLFILKRRPENKPSIPSQTENPTLPGEECSAENKEVEQSLVLQEEVVEKVSGVEAVGGQAVSVDFEKERQIELEAEVSRDDHYVEGIELGEAETGETGEDEGREAEIHSHEFLQRESYERWLFNLKEQRLAVLAVAIENNDEFGQEKHQVELVAITEGLSFSEQAYAESISCRKKAIVFLEEIKTGLSVMEYDMARKGICEGDTELAEQLFDTMVGQEDAVAAPAAYHGGCLAEQRMDFQKAMSRYEKAVAVDRDNPEFIRSAGLLSLRLYSYQEAQGYFSSLVLLFEKNNPDPVELALARRDYAYALAMIGKNKEAGILYKQAMHSLTQILGSDDPEMGVCWYQIAKLQEILGRYEQAEKPYRQALDIMEKSERVNVTCEITDKLARLYMELEREMEAVPLFERLCRLKEKSVYPDKATLAMAYNHLAEAYRICGKYEEAEKSFMRSLLITEKLYGKDHPAVGSVLQELSRLCERQKKTEVAKEYQDRATIIFKHIIDEQEAGGHYPQKLTL